MILYRTVWRYENDLFVRLHRDAEAAKASVAAIEQWGETLVTYGSCFVDKDMAEDVLSYDRPWWTVPDSELDPNLLPIPRIREAGKLW